MTQAELYEVARGVGYGIILKKYRLWGLEDDLYQESAVRMCEYWEQQQKPLEPERQVQWFAAIVHNVCRDWMRKHLLSKMRDQRLEAPLEEWNARGEHPEQTYHARCLVEWVLDRAGNWRPSLEMILEGQGTGNDNNLKTKRFRALAKAKELLNGKGRIRKNRRYEWGE